MFDPRQKKSDANFLVAETALKHSLECLTLGKKIEFSPALDRKSPIMTFEYIRTETGEFQCPHCPFVKKNQSTVHMHIKAKHSGAFKHKCEHCTYECPARQTLENHMAAKHPDQLETRARAFVCPDTCCGFESLTKAGLRSHYLLKHLSKHTNMYLGKTDTGIQCTHCGTDFQSKPSYVYHLAACLPSEVTSDPVIKKGLCI